MTIDGQAAPLLYVSPGQVTVQVPYEVTLGAGKQISVTKAGSAPATATATITARVPGIFTSDGSGVGQAAVLNYNAFTAQYTLNSSTNPAKLGDIIVLYLTGEGDYNLTLTPRTGLVIPLTMIPLPQLSPLPTVMIGGAAATVSYAGPLYGSMLGLLQMNVFVPATSTTGVAVPVSVTIGGITTQSNVTVALHP